MDLINTTSPIDNYVPRVGRIMIDNNIVTYSTRTDSSFTLTEPTTFTPETNSHLSIWYKLPSCVKSVKEVKIDNVPYIKMHSWSFNWLTSEKLYTVIDGYIYFGAYIDVANVNITYLTKSSKFVNTTDIIDIDSEFTDALSDYAAWHMLQNREDERWQWIEKREKLIRRKWMAFINRQKSGGNNKPFFDWALNRI